MWMATASTLPEHPTRVEEGDKEMRSRMVRAGSMSAIAVLGVMSLGLGSVRGASAPPAASPGGVSIPPTTCPANVPLAPGTIASIAGGGGAVGDGGQATASSIDVTVGGLAIDATGAVYFTGHYGQGVRRVSPDGVLSTVAADTAGTPLITPAGLDFDLSGNLIVVDQGGARIWRLDPSGQATAIAGTGTSASTGDGGPALEAAIDAGQVTVGPDGAMYVDGDNQYRVIEPDGTIRAFAGSGAPGFSGDGGPALQAMLGGTDPSDPSYGNVLGVATDSAGDVFLGDAGNQRVRRVDSNGVISTVAGSGPRGYTGDGGLALDATFQDPADLALDDAGNLYISDHHNDVVRKVDTSGVISTVAGTGHAGSPNDCGPATQANLQPWAIAVHDGYLYVGDMDNQRIRVVKL